MKSSLRERSFCEATDIIKNATEELKRLSLNSFEECFQHHYSRWQKCIVPQGNYFERNVAWVIILFCILQKQRNSGNIFELPRSAVSLHEINLSKMNNLTFLICHILLLCWWVHWQDDDELRINDDWRGSIWSVLATEFPPSAWRGNSDYLQSQQASRHLATNTSSHVASCWRWMPAELKIHLW
jgi:hypothetical protein